MNHREWIAKCLQLYWGKHVNIDQDIAAYFENVMANGAADASGALNADMSVSSISSTLTTSADGGDLGDVLDNHTGSYVDNVFLPVGGNVSDLSSESDSTTPTPTSKGTVSEKQNSEYREKELRIENMDAEDNNTTTTTTVTSPALLLSTTSTSSPPETPTHHHNKAGSLSESTGSSENNSPTTTVNVVQQQQQRKKRPLSDDSDDSIHGPEMGGLEIKDFVAYTRIKGRKGLQREYAQIKEEAPTGTFEESKYVALVSLG